MGQFRFGHKGEVAVCAGIQIAHPNLALALSTPMASKESDMQHIHHWQAALAQHRWISVTLTQLDGGYGHSFLPQIEDGTSVTLKASRAGCEVWLVDMQVKAFGYKLTRSL